MNASCEKMRQRIANAFTSGSSEDAAGEIGSHCAKCPECDRYRQSLQADHRELSEFAHTSETVIESLPKNVMRRLDSLPARAVPRQHFWRALTQSRRARLIAAGAGIVSAAAIVVALATFLLGLRQDLKNLNNAPIRTGIVRASPRPAVVPGTAVEKGDILVVAQVLEIAEGEKKAAADGAYVAESKAKLRVLRSFADLPELPVASGMVVNLAYTSGTATMDRVSPVFSKDEICLIPLRRPTDAAADWKLPPDGAEYDIQWGNLLICRRESPPKDLPISTRQEFAAAEVAANLVVGSYEQAIGTAQVYHCVPWPVAQIVSRMVEGETLVSDQWFQVGLALYSNEGIPRRAIAELLAPPGSIPDQKVPNLASLALRATDQKGLDERIIRALIANLPVNLWGAGTTLGRNYPTHPLVIELLAKRLQEHAPGAVTVAQQLALDKEHPLCAAAMDDAVARTTRDVPDVREWRNPDAYARWNDFRTACYLIHKFGTDAQFDGLVREFKRCREVDRNKYKTIWEETMSPQDQRLIALIRIAIDDDGTYGNGRFCESATWALQKATGEHFGIDPNDKDPSVRNNAVRKARAWLNEHPAK